MIKVLLVDDEPFIRQGLRILVNWEEHGYHVVGEAGNGIEAIEFLKRESVDLIFVDLKMPEMSGLEFIKQVSETTSYHIKFVILTGFADFEYAKTAIQYQVSEYMLKPIERQELVALLQRMNRDFMQEKLQKVKNESHERLTYRIQVSRILNGKYSAEDLKSVSERIVNDGNGLRLISFEFDVHDEKFVGRTKEQRMQMQIQALGLLEDILEDDGDYVAELPERDYDYYGAGLVFTDHLAQKKNMTAAEYFTYIQRRISGLTEVTVLVYAGMVVDDLSKIMESYHSIRVARCLRNFSEEPKPIAAYQELCSQKKMTGLERTLIDDLVMYVSNHQTDKIPETTEHLYMKLRQSAGVLDMIQANIYYLWYRLIELATKLDNELNQEEILQYISRDSFERVALGGSAEELTSFLLEYADYLQQIRSGETGNVLDRVEEHIREHYSENLSLKLLGEKFYINNVYLGQLFKKKYEVSFREYINQIRIEKAAELLENSNLRVYAIAEETGFHNADYFINKFVQVMGTTPQQYRMKHGKKKD